MKIRFRLLEDVNRLVTEVRELDHSVVIEKGEEYATDLIALIEHLDAHPLVERVPDKPAAKAEAPKNDDAAKAVN